MAFSMRFARFAKVGPPALILCSAMAGEGVPPVGETVVLMPGPEGKHVFRKLTWQESFTDDPLIVLTLAQMQGTIELGLLIPQHNVLEVVEFEPISEEELRMWRVLRQYEAIASIAPQIVAPDLVDAIAPYRDMNSVSPMVFRL
jgi:hypothetical protein